MTLDSNLERQNIYYMSRSEFFIFSGIFKGFSGFWGYVEIHTWWRISDAGFGISDPKDILLHRPHTQLMTLFFWAYVINLFSIKLTIDNFLLGAYKNSIKNTKKCDSKSNIWLSLIFHNDIKLKRYFFVDN